MVPNVNLIRHITYDLGKLDLSCSFCKKAFSRKDSLKRHSSICAFKLTSEKSKKNKKPVKKETVSKCFICDKTFSSKDNLNRHKKTFHLSENSLLEKLSFLYLLCSCNILIVYI